MSKYAGRQLLVVALIFGAVGVAILGLSRAASGPIPVGNPYIDPNQLSLKSPGVSFYTQPWRGYMETVPATQFLDGIGVNYNPVHSTPAQDNANLKYLASIGIHDIRIELPWDAVSPTDETQLTASNATKFNNIFAACKEYGITPTVLLNANDGQPEPSYPSHTATIVGSPQIGDSQITVSGIPASDITVHQPNTSTGASGITLGGIGEAGNLITNMVTNSDDSLTLTLSQPLKAVPTAGTVRIDYLKYLPLYAVGTPEFNNTMTGWNQYVKTATNTVESAGITNYSVEIWNELSFGSRFTSINSYYVPKFYNPTVDSEHPGGPMWELGNQTTKYLKSTYGSNVKVIWGFSNTSFYHTPSSLLPPDTDGESYHPYGTGLTTPAAILAPSNESRFLHEGSYVPNINVAIPEGYEALGIKIEQLIRGKLAPSVREASLPAGTTDFLHYITETGLDPKEDGVSNNQAQAQLLKSKAFLREYSFWLNKGLNQFDVYSAFGNTVDDGGFNMLASGSDVSGSPVTQQSQVLQNFTSQFAGAVTPSSPRSLGVTVNDITPNDNTPAYNVFPADPTTGEPALNYRELFQFLPFQVTDNKFVIPTYVMSWDLTDPPPPMDFEVDITNVNGTHATASYYDPITNTSQPITVVSRSSTDIVLDIEAVDYPRLITIDDSGGGASSPPALRGDITGPNGVPDGVIDLYDLSYVIRHYVTNDSKADITGPNGKPDGTVDIYDLSYIIRNYEQ